MNEFNTNQSSDDINIEKKENRNNTFNIVIGVSTLLIAILGATFAYFSATATSKENDVNVKSAYVSISYDGGTEIKASNLIPATERVALKMFQKEVEPAGVEGDKDFKPANEDENPNDTSRRCIDVKGKEVCAVYQFSITSDGEEGGSTEINGVIKVNENQFKELSYIVYEVVFKENDDGQILLDKYGHKIVKNYSLISEFDQVDDNGDHYDDDPNYAKFENPYSINGEESQVTIYPAACLFGYSDKYDNVDVNDPSRCKSISVTNKKQHTYQVMIWLRETGERQDEQGLLFQGTVSLEVAGGVGGEFSDYAEGKITGQQ